MIVSRHDFKDQTKCPNCRHINVDFIDLGNMLACLQCGCVFLSKTQVMLAKAERNKAIRSKHEEIKVDAEKSERTCKCGKECKSVAGLKAHQRGCNGA